METVIAAFPSETRRWSMHTTRSWEFIGNEERLMGEEKEKMPSRANFGKGTIVGLLDSGLLAGPPLPLITMFFTSHLNW